MPDPVWKHSSPRDIGFYTYANLPSASAFAVGTELTVISGDPSGANRVKRYTDGSSWLLYNGGAVTTDNITNVAPRSVSASGNFTVADAARPWVNNSGASNITLTIDTTLQYAVGDVLEGRAGSTGTVSMAISGGSSVLNTPAGAITSAPTQGLSVRARCVDATINASVWEYV